MLGSVKGINEKVIKINNYANIKKISENVIHETLESTGSIRKPKWHDKPFKRPVAGSKGCLPLVTLSNADKIVSVAEIDLRIDPSGPGSIKKISNQRERVSVLACNAV